MEISVKPNLLPPLPVPTASSDKQVAAPQGFSERLEREIGRQTDRDRAGEQSKSSPATDNTWADKTPADKSDPKTREAEAEPSSAEAAVASSEKQSSEGDEDAKAPTETETEALIVAEALPQPVVEAELVEAEIAADSAAQAEGTGGAVPTEQPNSEAGANAKDIDVETTEPGPAPHAQESTPIPSKPVEAVTQSTEQDELVVESDDVVTAKSQSAPSEEAKPRSAQSGDQPSAENPGLDGNDRGEKASNTTTAEDAGSEVDASLDVRTSDEPKQQQQSAAVAPVTTPQPAEDSAPAKAEEKPAARSERASGAAASAKDDKSEQAELPADTQADLQQAAESEPQSETAVEAKGREKPAARSETFQSIVERATSPRSRLAAAPESESNSAPRVDAARFVNRVANAFRAADERGGAVQLRLSPPELGAMKVELNVQHGVLSAKLETETAAAKNVLLDNLPALKERLAAQDIRIDKFEVDVRQHGSGSEPDWQAQQDSRDTSRQTAPRSPRRATSAADAPSATADTPIRNHHDGQFSAVA